MMPAGWLLVAAGLDWLEGLLPVLFVLIWIVSQVMNLFRGAAKKPVDAPAVPPRPAAGRGAGANPGDSLDGEIEEFLRRTLDRSARPQPVPQPAKPPRPRQRPRRATPPPVPAGGRGAIPAVERGDVAGHVATAFAHDLAHESPDRTVTPAAPPAEPSPASELVAALRAPGGLRQLILMREVLERPTQRW
jgi:hypothetical protein